MRAPGSRVAGLVELGERLVRDFSEHRMATYAAALAYRGLFALFPFALILVVLVGMLGSPDRLIEEARTRSYEQVPQQLRPVVDQSRDQIQPIEEIVEQAQRQAGGKLLFVGIAFALWSVSAFADTIIDALNTAHGATETRRWWKRLALSWASGPVLALAAIAAAVLMLTGPQVAEGVTEFFGLRELFVVLWGWLRFPVALVLLWVALSIVYRYGSAARQRYRTVVLGAFLAVVAWAVATVGFSVYLANFADFGVTYGSLGAAVGLLFYLYISASIVLMGAEVNAAIHHPGVDRSVRAEESALEREISTTQDGRTGDA